MVSEIGYSAYGSTSSVLTQTSGSSQSQQVNGTGDESENSSMESTIRSQIDALLANIPKGSDGKLSFKEVQDYLETEQKKWDEEVKADFEKLGINTYKEFPLSYDPANGTVVAAAGHPDKEKIDAYFKANQDKVDKFEEIVQIGKLTRTSQEKMTTTELQQSIQQKAMTIWFEDNSDPTTWFSGGGMMFGSYQNYSGLNIKV